MQNSTHIIVILDRSGSMASCIRPTIDGYNTFLSKQKELSADCSISFYQFNHSVESVYLNKDIKDAPDLNNETFIPNGTTALHDAIGIAIRETDRQFIGLDDSLKPARFICVIITDGEENSSREYNYQDINTLIQQKDKTNWEFVYLGANQDAIATASKMGIAAKSSITYNTSKMNEAFSAACCYTSGFRCASNLLDAKRTAFSEEDRKQTV